MLHPFWFSLLAAAASAAPSPPTLVLNIDECVAVDQPLVREIMMLEFADGQALQPVRPESITVRCLDDLQEIRVAPWAAKADEGSRLIQLAPVRDAGNHPERQARSRELALAIAEFVRRLETTPVPAPPPPPPEPVAATPPPIEEKPAVPAEPERWKLGALSSFDRFQGGQSLFGGEVFLAARWGRWFVTDVALGGRLATEQTLALPPARLDKWALTASAAVGLNLVPQGHRVEVALMMRVREYFVHFHAEGAQDGVARDTMLAATVLEAEPRISLAVTRHISLEASAAVGGALRGIQVRAQGVETQSLSGLLISGRLGAGVRF